MQKRLSLVRPGDMPAVWKLAQQQDERLGIETPVPRVFDDQDRLVPNIALALKTEIDGRLVRADFFERQLELISVGLDPAGYRFALAGLPYAMAELKEQGYQGFHALVAQARARHFTRTIGRRLGLKQDDDRIAHFYREFGETR